ncbi:MAG: nuclear transport factor 2 family protein [Acidobacteriota bacterium]
MSKSVVVALGLVVFAAGALAQAPAAVEAEKAAVRKVVQDAYVDGIHNFRRVEAVRAGFHPGFEMIYLREGTLEKLPIYNWIASLEAANRTKPLPPDHTPGTSAAYPLIEVTGDTAVCKVELTRGGKLVFTDYLMLYKFEDGWKIVGKVFHRHP